MTQPVGVLVRVRDAATMDDLGLATCPPPVEPDDLLAFAHGPPLRIVSVLPGSGPVVPVLASVVRLTLAGR